MIHAGATYGRYVDDIRLFGQSREIVIQQLRILQEQLLRKGLNLNSSKTTIAENETSQRELITHLHQGSDYHEEEDENAGIIIADMVDSPLEEFSRTFSETDGIRNPGDGKDFCKFLGAHFPDGMPMTPLATRQIWHVERLREIIIRWRGPTKHAAWLLVQTAVYRGVNPITASHAAESMLVLISDENVSSYARYRIVHHLLKLRQGRAPVAFRFINQLSSSHRDRLAVIFYNWLSMPAFELNLIGLYGMRVLGASVEEMRTSFAKNCRPHCTPVRDAISVFSELPKNTTTATNSGIEPDEFPAPY